MKSELSITVTRFFSIPRVKELSVLLAVLLLVLSMTVGP
jgi:hypothetical protein